MNHTAAKQNSHSRHKGLCRLIAADIRRHKGMVAIHHKSKDGSTVSIEWRKK